MVRRQTISEEDFTLPQLADIRQCWNEVKTGIESIIAEDSNLTFRPEDVYSECVNGRAELFTSPIGFLVLSTEIDPFTGDRTLLIWIAYVYKTGKHNWMKHVQWVEELARKAGCRYIEARSSVSQMEEYALRQGFSLNTRVYTKEVNEQ